MLEASGAVTYVNEPLNPEHPPGHSPGVLARSPDHQFQYICADNEAEWLPAFQKTVALRYGVVAELRRNRAPYDLARMTKYATAFGAGRMRQRRAMIDDPFALFSTRWLVERLGARALVLVRDPVAVVGSYRRFGWTYRPEELAAQILLVRDLDPPPTELLALAGSDDHVAKLAHLWRVAYTAIDKIRDVDGVVIRRYEDLVREPLEGFRDLYDAFGLPWTDKAQQRIEAATTAAGGGERGFAWSLKGGLSRTAFRPMDSEQALTAHVGRLSEEDAQRVREITADVAARFYS
jgi:Sulfotransferase family